MHENYNFDACFQCHIDPSKMTVRQSDGGANKNSFLSNYACVPSIIVEINGIFPIKLYDALSRCAYK